MHSNKSITWQITDNSVKNRMIDNSLLHTFVSSQKIRKRTKVINAELKKYGVKDYKDYIDLKTNILRYLEEDPDTDDPGYLTDVDYSIIYSSESTQAKYIAERTKKTYNFASDVNYKTYKSKNNTKNTKNTKNIKNTKLKRKDDQREQRKNTEVQNKHRVQRNKSLETKHNTSNKYINIGWQEVIRQRDVSHLSDNRTSTNISNNEKDTSEDEECNFLKTQFNNQSFSQQLTCQSSTLSNTIKSRNRKTKKNNKGSNVMVNKLYSEDNTILNEIKVISENKVQNYEHQNRVLNDLTSDLDSQSSHYSATPSKSTEDINDFNNELNSITQNSEDSIISSKIEVFNESTEQIYGHQDAALNESNAKLELQSPHCKATSSESTENINDFNNELNPITSNSEDGIISSKIEVFDENKEQIYGHQDAALNESNAKLESQSPHCKATPSKSTENNDFNNELNPITSNSEDGIISSKIEVFDESKEQIYRPQDTVLNESKVKSDSQSPHCKVTLSKSTENINDFNDELNPITLEENNSDKLTQANNEHLINTDNCNSYKSKLLKNVRRKNRLNHDQLHLSTVNSSRHSTPLKKKRINVPKMSNSSPETSSFDQHKDSGFDDDSQDKFFKIEKSNIKSSTSPNVAKKIVSPKHPKKSTNVPDTNDLKDSKEDKNNTHLKIYDDCLLEQDNKEVTDIHSEEEEIKNSSPDKDVELSTINQEGEQSSKETKESFDEEEVKNSLQLNQVHKDTEISIKEDKMHTVKSESDIQKQSLLSPKKEYRYKIKDSCDTKKLHLPKITCTEIINTKYKIINIKTDNFNSDIKKVDNINDTNEYTPLKNNASINRSNVNWQDEVIDVKEINNDTSTVETDNEEENTQKNTRLSLQTQKRLQQQAKLNLVVNSDSSDSDNAEDVTEISRKSINNSDVSHCSENDSLNDESNHACKQIDIISIDISSSEDICSKKTSVSTKDVIKQNATKMKEEIKKKSDKTVLSTKCTYENSSLKSAANKNLLKETRCSENVNNNDEHVEDIERSSLSSPKDTLSEFSLRISESNVSCNNNNSNQFSKDNQSSLDKENMRNKSNQWEHSVRTDDLETSCRSGLDISHYERPYNLQQLVEAQKLLVETLPTSFTLADISDDDEAFILNIPNKVLQYNLQDQFLTIKGDTIKFGKHKYKIMRKKVDTTSCVFATGKERKPYKIVNINEISTVTVRERLPPYLEKSDILASHSNVISTESKSPKINNRQTNKRDLKLKISGHKRKRYTSDFEIKQSAVRKKRLKVSHS
nr:PREDICTED: putative uncharacterized protein DDB_G0282133 [Linepithema humile]